MVTKRKTVTYPEKLGKPTRAELKPLVYMLAIGVPFVFIMWALRKENNSQPLTAKAASLSLPDPEGEG